MAASTAWYKTLGDNVSENYERYFVPVIGRLFASDLVSAAEIDRGERVLDVACGTGIATRLSAERVGPEGTVAGLDVNAGMLAVARSLAPSIEWHEASAEAMPLPDQMFDVVISSLGLEFMPNKVAVLREMRRVLAPGGRLAVNLVGPIPDAFNILAEALGRHTNPEAAGFVRQVFSLHDVEEIQELIDAAYFRDVSVQPKMMNIRLPSRREFLWQYLRSTPLAQAVTGLNDDGRAAMERDVVAGWERFVGDDGLVIEVRSIIATGRRDGDVSPRRGETIPGRLAT